MATSSDPATELSTQENTALITQESTSSARDKKWASGSDWDRHRTQITQLYQTKTLKKVMRIMDSEFGFKATPRMYKTRIQQWGLDKNNKESEMRAIVRKRDQRQRQGKSSAFRIRGKAIDFGDIVRYWERRGISIEDVVAQRTMSATPDAVVECSTPVPSQPSTPAEFAIPESVIRSIRNYFQGSFESGTWYSEDPRDFCKRRNSHYGASQSLELLYDQCMLSCDLFERSEPHEAGRMLICATASIKEILQAEDPGTLMALFKLVIDTAHANRLGLAIAILRQFADLGDLIMGGGHPLSRVSGWLASLESTQFQDVLDICVHTAIDQFEHYLGPMHHETLNIRLEHAYWSDFLRNNGQGHSVIEKLLASCIQSLGYCDIRTLNCYSKLTHQHMEKGDFIAVQGLARQIIQYSHNVEPRINFLNFYAQGLHFLAQAQYRLGEAASAEANQRQAIELRMSILGTTDPLAGTWLLVLEGWVAEQGNLAYAAELRGCRLQIFSSMEMDEP